MQTVCDIAVDIIDDDMLIGDSLRILNKNFQLLNDITCGIDNTITIIPMNLNSITSLSGVNGISIEKSANMGVLTVSQTLCDPWHVGKTKKPLYTETDTNRMSYQFVQPENYIKYLQFITSQNVPIPGNEKITSIPTGITFTGKRHSDVVTLGDGRIFFVPSAFPKGVIFDPLTEQVFVTPNNIGTGFVSGCLLPDGRVCMVPGQNKYITFWDPRTGNVSKSSVDLSIIGYTQPYNGGVLLGDGQIMLIPYERNDGTLIYDPVTDTVHDLMSSLFTSPNGKSFHRGQLVHDGTYVIFTPYNSTYSLRVETDYPYDVYKLDALGAPFIGNGAYSDAVLLPDGKVFFVPYNATTGVVYDPVKDKYTAVGGIFPGNNSYLDGFLLSDGRVCMPPYGASNIAFYDPKTNTTLFSSNVGGLSLKYCSGTMLENGDAIIAPCMESDILRLSIGVQATFSRTLLTGPLYSGY